MSKLNLLTIGVVILAILAIIFLVLQTKSMLSNDQQGEVKEVEETMEDRYSDDEEYNMDDETENIEDDDEVAEEVSDENSESSSTPESKKVNNTPSAENDTEIETYIDTENEGDYLVIGGSFKLKQNAEIMVKMLQRKGYSDAHVAIFNKGAYASVIVDRFDNENEAKKLAKELYDNHRIEAYVHKKR